MDIDAREMLFPSEPVCYIFGAGSFYGIMRRPKEKDLVIAADGGLRVLEELEIRPDIVLGDFDSGDAEEARALAAASGAELVRLNVIKNVSDSAAAMDLGRERGFCLFHFYGCTGGRLDHTLANIQDIAELSREDIRAVMFDEGSAVTALSDGSMSFPPEMKGFISVFSHTGKSDGVFEEGLKYRLSDAELRNGFPLGLSNEFTGEGSRISIRKGTLIIYFQTEGIGENEDRAARGC